MGYREFTEQQVREAIFATLKAGNTDMTRDLLVVYARWYPEDCEVLMLATNLRDLVT